MPKRNAVALLSLLIGAAVLAFASSGEAAGAKKKAPKLSPEGKACLSCHESQSPSFVKDWQESRHAAKGVDCYSCHRAEPGDVDAMNHYGYTIAVLVTPKDCGACHPREVREMTGSHHAAAGDILNSLDDYLGEVVGGPEAVTVGCVQCHGSKVKVLANGKLDTESWPNTGIGRINPDGSKGSCSACHTRHSFSVAQARQPEACGKCHLGPDHPQTEVYKESKHGILYAAKKDQLNLDRRSWVVGKDYTAAPTCTTCHMGATTDQPATHDVGTRLSWTLRPPISKKQENADQKRAAMKDVCSSCHSAPFVDGHYKQFDELVDLYDSKFATPAAGIMKELAQRGLIKPVEFDKKLDWKYFELWHHEGRRARHGAAMSGPDYAWWHGIYDVSENFYTEFLPEVKELAGPAVYDELVQKYLAPDPRHEWYIKGMSKEQLDRIKKFYQERYGEKVQ